MKMKVYILDNGYLECDRNWIIGMSVFGTASCPRTETEWIKLPVYSVLIDHPEMPVLFDLSCPREAGNGYWPRSLYEIFPYHFSERQTMVRQLALAGYKPEDIPVVVLSHLHLDHAGNLSLFKHAEVYTSRREFEHAQATVRQSPDPLTHGAYNKRDLDVEVKCFHLFDEDFELLPDIRIINLPGHTPGLCGLMVELEKDGTLVFPSDAVYTKENYGPPPKRAGIIHDSLAYDRSVEKVRKLTKENRATVFFSHDIEAFTQMKKAPDFYE